MKWWGWGSPAKRAELGPEAAGNAPLRAGRSRARAARRSSSRWSCPAPRPLPAEIADAVGPAAVLNGHEHRVRRAAGRGYPDLVRLRAGRLEDAPDAVVLPGSVAEVARVLEICSREGVAVVPFGGGTSVVGGVEPLRGGFESLLSLDLRRLREVVVDRRSLTATLGPGLRGPEAEEALQAQGVTLGHFPQSFEYATIGGFAATRSAGQASSGYGRFDELVTSIALTAPAGDLRTLEIPHSAAGPALRELVVGSEGALGRDHAGDRAGPAASGAAPLRGVDGRRLRLRRRDRALARAGRRAPGRGAPLRPGGDATLAGALGDRRGQARPAVELPAPARPGRRLPDRLRLGGRARSGRAPPRAVGAGSCARAAPPLWAARPAVPGSAGATRAPTCGTSCSTSATWPRPSRRPTPGAASASCTTRSVPRSAPRWRPREPRGSSCATSRTPTGTAPRSTSPSWRARRPGAELEQWRAVKAAACQAIVETGGTITHHHAVGRDHLPYMRAEIGELGIEALRAVKERLDPGRDHESGQADPLATATRQGFQGFALEREVAGLLDRVDPAGGRPCRRNGSAGSGTRPGTPPCRRA